MIEDNMRELNTNELTAVSGGVEPTAVIDFKNERALISMTIGGGSGGGSSFGSSLKSWAGWLWSKVPKGKHHDSNVNGGAGVRG